MRYSAVRYCGYVPTETVTSAGTGGGGGGGDHIIYRDRVVEKEKKLPKIFLAKRFRDPKEPELDVKILNMIEDEE